MKAQTKAIVASVVVIALALSAVSGITYSWFSDTQEANVIVSTAVVDYDILCEKNGTNENLTITDSKIVINNLAPADEHSIKVTIKNKSTIQTTCRVYLEYKGDLTDYDKKNILIDGVSLYNSIDKSNIITIKKWVLLDANENLDVFTITLSTSENYGNKEEAPDDWSSSVSKSFVLRGVVEAYQGNYVPEGVANVGTLSDLKTKLNELAAPKAGDNIINITEDITLGENDSWESFKVDGYGGAGIITVNGNGHTIFGLNTALFEGGFGGRSGIIINDLTISGAEMSIGTNYNNKNLQGFGAFISNVEAMTMVVLNNCHLEDSKINSVSNARVGGLIGWTAGYNNPNDGPVDTYILIKG